MGMNVGEKDQFDMLSTNIGLRISILLNSRFKKFSFLSHENYWYLKNRSPSSIEKKKCNNENNNEIIIIMF